MTVDLDNDDSTLMKITIGEYYECALNFVDSSNDAKDMTDPVVTKLIFCIKESLDDTDANAELTVTVDLTDADHTKASGIFILKLLTTETDDLTEGRYFWQLRIERASKSPKNSPDPAGEVVVQQRARRTTTA